MTDITGTDSIGATVLGYPRIGPNRELKRAVERYWAGSLDQAGLRAVAAGLHRDTWTRLRDAGLDSVPGNTFSYYDHVVDTAQTVGAVPARFAALGLDALDTMFAMARGHGSARPLELTKFFDTNYHYLVPELGPDTALRLADRKPLDEFSEALDAGVRTRPVLLGPVTFLLLAKPTPGFSTLELLEPLVEVYAQLLTELGRLGAGWVQLDEPALVADRTDAELECLAWTYRRLGAVPGRPKVLVASYYGSLGPALPVLAASPVEAIGLDLVAGIEDLRAAVSLPALRDKTVLAGVVDGRNVWRTDLDAALGRAATLLGTAGRVEVGTSCPLLHVPYDVGVETALAPAVHNRLAFAEQKVAEVVLLGRALREGRVVVAGEFAAAKALRTGVDVTRERDHRVRARLDSLG
ncbi:MAG TPA: 5-methyltetrahydropteroyltriglutamate--homocysteine S-methyltransferase, partial [Pseudonocardiaceae bacterium]|nr:5-methyltetrahydropteroyltriglutamate--homocysteine S-methyltransferase [Pseudonocardiaceae bacterium]